MELFLTNNEIDRQMKDIKQKIYLSMNGIVSEQMTNSGINYRKNYGVSIPRILEISKIYEPNRLLAHPLWAMGIRETMMLAILLEPIENFTIEMAKKRILEIKQLDLAEFASMYLFSKLPYASELCINCIFSEDLWSQTIGFMIAARIVEILNEDEIKTITDRALNLSESNEFQLYRSISVCLSKLCRKNTKTASNIYDRIKKLNSSEISGQQYIFQTVNQEITFLNLL